MGVGRSVAMTKGVIVDVVVVTVCGARGVAGAAGAAGVAGAADAVVVDASDTMGEIRIHARTPRFNPRAPSTPSELVIPGFVIN